MKRANLLIICFVYLNICNSQSNQVFEQHLNVYRIALNSGDMVTAAVALNYIITFDSTENYQDSLVYLYYSFYNYNQSLFWSERILLKNPVNIGILEIKAASLSQIGKLIPAIEVYEKLLLIDKNPIYYFNLVELQYKVKRLLECITNTIIVEQLIPKDLFYKYYGEDNVPMKTPISAAFLNYKGLAYFELG